MGPNAYYAIQPAFTGGEISPDVASRVDIDKYQLALLQAENAIIRPYGAVTKRPGLIYCGAAKNADKKVILWPFKFDVSLNYLLEFGHQYVRVWKGGVYLGVQIATPFEEDDLSSLRFVQSVDVLYICSGKYPVIRLMRYSENDWRTSTMSFHNPPMAELNPDSELTVAPSSITGSAITLTSSSDLFSASDIGRWMEISQRVGGSSVSITHAQSNAVWVGGTWKIITHGTWKGSVTVQSYVGGAWVEERKYTGNEDFNATETGTVEGPTRMRVVLDITSGTCTCDFSAFPYVNVGYIRITGFTDSRHVTASVQSMLGDLSATADWRWGAWDAVHGYPACAAFFQDRLCFAGSYAYPQRIWMSRTGDYENFSVEKASGTVTDDSAVTADLLSLASYRITHMIAGNDLILLTNGNEWTISGSETVTPSNITPRSQQSFGANDVIPIRSGNRTVYVQRRGSIVRDIGYNWDSDSYAGMDLSLLVRHLIRGHALTSSTYAQEPDSLIYFVRDDGVLLALTYMYDQKVYAWSHMVTDGEFESVCAVGEGNRDVVYAVVKRTINGNTVRYIERFDESRETGTDQQDYCMIDSAVRYSLGSAASTITGLSHLEGESVIAMGDGYLFNPMTVENGTITLPQAAKRITVGLPYTMRIEQPNIESQTGDGTLQGREKAVTTCILRLTNSFGGEVGPNEAVLNDIIYDVGRMELGESVLYSGDLISTMAAGGFNKNGRVFIKHDVPYPFTLSAIVRAITFGGTGGLRN